MKMFITNRQHKKICVVVEGPLQSSKLAFVMHGLGGRKDQLHIRAMAEAFLEHDYIVVTFDATNSFGESEGDYADATVTNYYNDLEDVINWAANQSWYSQSFVLCGHSLGGISTTLFAQNYPDKVRALAPIATVVSGELSFAAHTLTPEIGDLDAWKLAGVLITKSRSGTTTLKWSHMEDRLKYSVLTRADLLTMPVLLVVGEKDNRTPPDHQKLLLDKLPGKKELHIIPGAEHSFYKSSERQELKRLISGWIDKLD